MLSRFGTLTLIVGLFTTSLSANSILWKVEPNGKKVFYNKPVPRKATVISRNGTISLGYSYRFEKYSGMIEETCNKHGVDPELVKAVIQVESNYNYRAISPKGAQGLMQLMPGTASRYGVLSAFEPAQNIEGGVRYLKDLIQLFNSDLRLALAAYNAGENRVQKINDVPNFVETQNYVRKVLALYNGEMSYTPVNGVVKPRIVSYYKYVDEKGVTHYSAEPVSSPEATKVTFSY
jgi:soluble lytic murein transglycosylase-like protein